VTGQPSGPAGVATEYVWVFVRGVERSEIRRPATIEGDDALLTVTTNGTVRSYVFRDLSSLLLFQGELEKTLLDAGWSFAEFCPERRSGADRSRRTNRRERRRWWPRS
jgi:hypothetical protein